MMTGLFGGEGFIMQKLEGDGWVFVQMGGTVVERELAPGQQLHVDTGCLAAYTPSVDFDLVAAGGVHGLRRRGRVLRPPDRTGVDVAPLFEVPAAAALPYGGQSRGEGPCFGSSAV